MQIWQPRFQSILPLSACVTFSGPHFPQPYSLFLHLLNKGFGIDDFQSHHLLLGILEGGSLETFYIFIISNIIFRSGVGCGLSWLCPKFATSVRSQCNSVPPCSPHLCFWRAESGKGTLISPGSVPRRASGMTECCRAVLSNTIAPCPLWLLTTRNEASVSK